MKKFTVLCLLLVSSQVMFAQESEEIVEEVVIEEEVIEEKEVEEVPFAVIEEVPVYPGCTGTRQEKKHCLNISVQKHVVKNFNIKKIRQLGLDPGKKKIYVKFRIDKNGKVSRVVARGPHKKAEKEGARVVKLLPTMIPGKQRGKFVNVTYMLPITFKIE